MDSRTYKPDNVLDLPEHDKVADTPQNAAAGQFLAQSRRAVELKQLDFARTLSDKLGIPISQSTLSGWENGTRSVPGAVIVACLELLGKRLDAGTEPAPIALRDEVGRLGGAVRRLVDGLEALEAPGGRARPTNAERAARIHDIALEIRGLLAEPESPSEPSEKGNA